MKIINRRALTALGAVLALTTILAGLSENSSGVAHAEWIKSRSATSTVQPKPDAEEQKMSARQFERWRRNEFKKLKALMETDPEAVAWGKKRKANRSTVIVLDPPLPKLSGPGKVDVEIFYSYLDELGRGTAFTGSMVLWNRWSISRLKEDRQRFWLVQEHAQIVGNGPKLPTRFAEQQQNAQKLHYGSQWYREDRNGDKDTGWKVFEELVGLGETGGLIGVDTEEKLEEVVTAQGIPVEEWRSNTSSYVKKRSSVANSRWAKIVEQGTKAYDKAFDGLSDPILLIDGKFLITRNTMARHGGRRAVQRVYQTANWLIRERMERNPRYEFDTKAIHEARKPARKEIIALEREPEDPHPKGLKIEWLYSYISDDGQRTHSSWLSRTFNEWLRRVQNEGTPVQFTRTPVTGTPGNPWHQHQAVHQMLALTGTMASGERWEGVGESVGWWLNGNPQGLSTEEEVSLFLLSKGIPKTAFMTRAASKETREKAEAANARAETVRRALKARRLPDIEPVLLINGKWILSGGSAGNTGHVFEILNWLRENV